MPLIWYQYLTHVNSRLWAFIDWHLIMTDRMYAYFVTTLSNINHWTLYHLPLHLQHIRCDFVSLSSKRMTLILRGNIVTLIPQLTTSYISLRVDLGRIFDQVLPLKLLFFKFSLIHLITSFTLSEHRYYLDSLNSIPPNGILHSCEL